MIEKTLSSLKQENLELVKENEALKINVVHLLKEIEKLRSLSVNPHLLKLTPEQRIIEDQIRFFEILSSERALSLEETRALDLLIKNKRLLDENAPIAVDPNEMPENTPESDLLRIAGNVEESKFKKRRKTKTGSKDTVE